MNIHYKVFTCLEMLEMNFFAVSSESICVFYFHLRFSFATLSAFMWNLIYIEIWCRRLVSYLFFCHKGACAVVDDFVYFVLFVGGFYGIEIERFCLDCGKK